MGESGYPGPGHALLIGYTASPLQPAGASAGWPRRERALVAFRVAALPGDAAASEPGQSRSGRTIALNRCVPRRSQRRKLQVE